MARIVRTPPPPDPKQIEAQDWQRVAGSTNPDDFDAFIRKHPEGAHLEEARKRAADLREQAQANSARQAEQQAWAAADKTDKTALQDYLRRFPSGAHTAEARSAISKLEAAEKIASDQQREQQAATARAAADRDAIERTLKSFEDAYNRLDVSAIQSIWLEMPPTFRDQFRFLKTASYRLQPTAPIVPQGDTATVLCTRSVRVTTRDGGHPPAQNDNVRVVLVRSGSRWVIRSISSS